LSSAQRAQPSAVTIAGAAASSVLASLAASCTSCAALSAQLEGTCATFASPAHVELQSVVHALHVLAAAHVASAR
jgi:hypothetical protein